MCKMHENNICNTFLPIPSVFSHVYVEKCRLKDKKNAEPNDKWVISACQQKCRQTKEEPKNTKRRPSIDCVSCI